MPTNKLEYPIPRRRTISDPLAAALQPPVDESPVARELRLKAEIDAKKVSDSIDDMIRQERNDRKRSKPEVSVLLLGQSESGKSTTLKRESRSRRAVMPSPHFRSHVAIPARSSISVLTHFLKQSSSSCTLPLHSTQSA